MFEIKSIPTSLQTRIVSFGFKHGLPVDVDLVFDCRFLPNPYWEEELRDKTGEAKEVKDFLLEKDIAQKFITQLESMLEILMPAYLEEGKSYLSLGIGCTGGKHRSVVMAIEAERILAEIGFISKVSHRDIRK